jgi:hypothetical protein
MVRVGGIGDNVENWNNCIAFEKNLLIIFTHRRSNPLRMTERGSTYGDGQTVQEVYL